MFWLQYALLFVVSKTEKLMTWDVLSNTVIDDYRISWSPTQLYPRKFQYLVFSFSFISKLLLIFLMISSLMHCLSLHICQSVHISCYYWYLTKCPWGQKAFLVWPPSFQMYWGSLYGPARGLSWRLFHRHREGCVSCCCAGQGSVDAWALAATESASLPSSCLLTFCPVSHPSLKVVCHYLLTRHFRKCLMTLEDA